MITNEQLRSIIRGYEAGYSDQTLLAIVNSDQPAFSTLEMEAALCVWEDINDRTLLSNAEDHPAINRTREEWGSFAMRHACIPLGQWVLKVYDAAGGSDMFDGFAYDWEVVPFLLDQIDWEGFIPAQPVLPDVDETAAKARSHFEAKRAEWP